jgi:hypothetical protein
LGLEPLPDIDFNIMSKNQNLFDVTTKVLLSMKNLLFKSNPNELSSFSILLQMFVFGAIGLGSIIAIFYLISNVF